MSMRWALCPSRTRMPSGQSGSFEGNLTTQKYARFANCSHDTALRDIKQLLEQRILVQNPPGGRNTSCALAPLAETGTGG